MQHDLRFDSRYRFDSYQFDLDLALMPTSCFYATIEAPGHTTQSWF